MPKKLLKLGLGTLVLSLLVDLASKWAIQRYFQIGESLPLLPGLALTYVRNSGAAFSMLAGWDASLRLPLFFSVTIVALGAIAFYFRSLPEKDFLSAFALGLVAGGAVGNFIDRVRYGEVVDFIEVGVRSVYTWPIFNVADSCVCVGVGFLIWRSFKPAK